MMKKTKAAPSLPKKPAPKPKPKPKNTMIAMEKKERKMGKC